MHLNDAPTASRMAVVALALFCAMASGCHIGPRYRLPTISIAPIYKEAGPSIWNASEPKDEVIRGKWWEMFDDSQLNALEERVDTGNQSIAAAAAQYEAACAVVRQNRSQYSPTLTTTPALENARVSAVPYAAAASGTTYSEYSFPVTASWEPDLWGRVHRSVEASAYTAQSSAADMENVRLLAHAGLAADYFQLRGVEKQKEILDSILIAWQRYLGLTQSLTKSGLATDETLAAAESQLEAARAQDTNLGIARAQYEHAIAILVGESPSSFAVPAATKEVHLPQIPAGVPAQLLERRPDIAAAERAMAAANSQIGAAKTAYFPNIVLTATGGIESLSFTDWFTWPARFWSIGPSVAETLFDAGLRKATVVQYSAAYDEAIANYRQTTLTAFQQVEDDLAALRILSEDLREQGAAVQSARRYLSQARARNTAGLDPDLNVLSAQVSLLVYQETYVEFRTQQYLDSVLLIEALGGGWNSTQLPTPKQVSALTAKGATYR